MDVKSVGDRAVAQYIDVGSSVAVTAIEGQKLRSVGMRRRPPLRSPGDSLWTRPLRPLLGARNPQTKERNRRLPSNSLTRRASSGGQLTRVFSTAASDRPLLPRGPAHPAEARRLSPFTSGLRASVQLCEGARRFPPNTDSC